MNHQPFSVAMSVYKNDNASFFDRALESITEIQTVKPNEIVLVVDGPVPNEINRVINKYLKKFNFKVIRLETNAGLGNALKIAIENCSFELVARMDSDDVSAYNRFEQQLLFFSREPHIDIIGGDISEFIDSENNIISYRNVPMSHTRIKSFIKKSCPLNHVTVMFKKTSVINAGGYLDWHYNEDYYLWIRMYLNNCVFANTGTVLVNVRSGLDQFARRGGWKYYQSERMLQTFMLSKRMISFPRYLINCSKRFIIQVMLPNRIRGWLYMHRGKKPND